MKNFFSFFVLFLCTQSSFSQDTSMLVIKAGTNVLETVPQEKLYHYPVFTDAIVHMRNGRLSKGKLNYFALTDEMQFLGPTGDTTTLANEETISFIAIGKDTFFYEKGYLKLVSSYQGIKLAQAQRYQIVDRRKKGGYDQSMPATSMTSITTYTDGNRTVQLSINEDVILKKSGHYYIGDRLNHFTWASKSELNKRFSKSSQAIKNYLKEEKIDYANKEDLEKLTRFLSHFSTEILFND
jgi:hypothetical protein